MGWTSRPLHTMAGEFRYAHLNGGPRGSGTVGDPTAVPYKSQFWVGVTYNF